MNDLSITIIQSPLHWENKMQNLNLFASKIAAIQAPTDIIVLPEMFSTGFTMNSNVFADTMDGETVEWMHKQAEAKKCIITGSVIIKENNNYYNRLIWMRPDGTYQFYDKRHLFRMAGEENHYTAGNSQFIVSINGWKIRPLICYDLRFPVWSRNQFNIHKTAEGTPEALAAYDVLIYVANWPERRSHPWKTLLLARAIENQCYVVGVNRIGNDGHGISHAGDSAVINPRGEIISTLKANEEASETVSISYQELEAFRKLFPVGLDSDKFNLL